MNSLKDHIKKIPEGYTEGLFKGTKYGITKKTFNEGKSCKIYAKELKGTDFISLNFYLTDKNALLKPCEMPEEKVLNFLENVELINKRENEMLNWKDVLQFAGKGNPEPDRRVEKTEAEWREQLTDEEFRVTRQKGTERAFSSEMCSRFEPGNYECICCGTLLFDANEKFESGTGWPSFTQPVKENAIAYIEDRSFGMSRIETICNTCDAHLGHVFPDGPAPSGLRYCMNAVALKKVE